MDGYPARIALVLLLVLVNAVFAGSEVALLSLRESQLHRLEQAGARGRAVARLARDPNRYLATVQIGITLAGFLASAAAAVALSEPLVGPLGFLGGAARPVAIITVTAALTFFTLVLGELAPKRIAMAHAERWALLAGRGLDVLSALSRPLVWLLGRSTELVVRLAGVTLTAKQQEITSEEIRDLVATQAGLTSQQRTIIAGAVDIAGRSLRQVLIPRRDVATLSAELPVPDGIRRLAATGHSRAPVLRGADLQDTVGTVHLRDLLRAEDPTATVASRMHPPLSLPDTLTVADAMREMRNRRVHMALVIDEHGAVDGIVTLEDLIEEVVGEIYEETDRDVQTVAREPGGAVLLPGSYPIHDLPDIGIRLKGLRRGAYTTVAGLVLERLGHVPERPGEVVNLDGWRAEVVQVARHAITRVRLYRR